MDRPFRMAAARAGNLFAVPVDQHEIVGSEHLAKPDAVALHPEAAPGGIAPRQVAERHVAVPLHLEDATGAREVVERGSQVLITSGFGHRANSLKVVHDPHAASRCQ